MSDITFVQKVSFLIALALVIYIVSLSRFRSRR